MSRKFKEREDFDQQAVNSYYLLPFKFWRFEDRREIIVNEFGDHLLLEEGTVEKIVSRQLLKSREEELYEDLISNFFISEERIPPLIDVMATRYRTKKSFLDNFTSLHIFVLTLRCEHTCHYCQVSRVSEDKQAFDMANENIDHGIEMMMKSPNKYITMEFQGGEPLLVFDKIKYAVEAAARAAIVHEKQITYVICTNLALITEDMLLYCKEKGILISTSLDGPAEIHNSNRKRPGPKSHDLATQGIELSRKVLGNDKVSALMTTTALSLDYPEEIVDEYYHLGFRNIFLRSISPYGFARKNDKKNKYEMDRFIIFYKRALKRILEYNRNGIFFSEDYTTILLKKILTPFPVGYVDLSSPAGAIVNVIVFNYDGGVYASDESRMLAQTGNNSFKLGELGKNSYEEIFYGPKALQIVEQGINESLPGCETCAFQSFCGADPIHNMATQGDMVGFRPTNSFCQKNMSLIAYLIDLMHSDPKIASIFETWIN